MEPPVRCRIPQEKVEQIERFAEMDPNVRNLSMAEKVQRLAMAETVQRSYDERLLGSPPSAAGRARRGSVQRRGSTARRGSFGESGRRISLEPMDPRKRQRRIEKESPPAPDTANLKDDKIDGDYDYSTSHTSTTPIPRVPPRRGSFVPRRTVMDPPAPLPPQRQIPEQRVALANELPDRRGSYGRRRRISLEPSRLEAVRQTPPERRVSQQSSNSNTSDPNERGAGRGEGEETHSASSAGSVGRGNVARRRRLSLEPSPRVNGAVARDREEEELYVNAGDSQQCASEQREENRVALERQRQRRPGRRISIERPDPTVQGQFDD